MGRRPPERRFFTLFMSYWLPVLLYVTVIIVVSAQPHLTPPFRFHNSDKIWHVLEYFGLGVLLARAFRASFRGPSPLHASLLALCLGIAVGTGDELFQSTVPGRQSSGFDLLADTVGVALAQLAYLAAARE
jgi:VanZ family protein